MTICAWCTTEFKPFHKKDKFCSPQCGDLFRKRERSPNKSGERICSYCLTPFPITNRGDSQRKYCSKECSKAAWNKPASTKKWNEQHPGKMKEYNKNRVAKDPSVWRKKWDKNRGESLRILGGQCVVCGVSNPLWLHIDYIPTSKGMKYRHPRGIKFIREHLSDFRLLCANHHYELTLTGKIEGTDITQ